MFCVKPALLEGQKVGEHDITVGEIYFDVALVCANGSCTFALNQSVPLRYHCCYLQP